MSLKKGSNRSWSLAGRLTAWYTLASITLTLLTTGILYWALAADLNSSEDLFLADKVHVLRAILRDRPADIAGLKEEVELESAARQYSQFYVRLLDEDERPILTTPGMDELVSSRLFTTPIPPDVEPGNGTNMQATNRSLRALAAWAKVGESTEKKWAIQVALDRGNDKKLLANYRQWLWAVLGVAVVVCPLAGYRFARRGIRPVQEIAETARRTGSATLDARIDPSGYPVELASLALTFNAMLDRLEDSFRRLSQFSADIAHELRTPISNVRGEAEVALSRARSMEEYREALTSCLEESVRLSDLIENLLFLARAESPGMHLKREEVHLIKNLTAVCEYYEAAAAEAGVRLSVESGDEVTLSLDRGLLQRAVANLVANAIAHTPAGGTVTLRANADSEHARIEVCDTGVGIPSEDLVRVFDRFYRVDRARSSGLGSVGLGLAIVKGIAVLHGGWPEIESEPGRGTRIVLVFPTQRNNVTTNMTKS
jgi:two-component system heavy metal sensor histidine kinase CusS